MKSPWKVVSELVFRRDKDIGAKPYDEEKNHPVDDTTDPVVTSAQIDTKVPVLSDEIAVSVSGQASGPAKRRAGRSESHDSVELEPTDVVASRERVSSGATTQPPQRPNAGLGSKRKSTSGRTDVSDRLILDTPTPHPDFTSDATKLNAKIQDLRAMLSARLISQNTQLRALLNRYD